MISTTYLPEEVDCFFLQVRVIVGPQSQPGEESFDVRVCTPKWLLKQHGKEDVIVGRHLLIVFQYDFDRIRAAIVNFCESCTGESWREVAEKVGRLGYWEFEDYHEPGH